MREIWRELSGAEGLPELIVSNFGNVKDKCTKRQCKFYNCKGYLVTSMNFNGKRKSVKAHRLVAMAFLPNPNNYLEVNHINGIKTDNRVENLEWCSRSQNAKHAYDTKLNHPHGGVPRKPILCVELGRVFPSINAAARHFGNVNNRQRIGLSAKNNQYKSCGYHWKFLNEGGIAQ